MISLVNDAINVYSWRAVMLYETFASVNTKLIFSVDPEVGRFI